MKSPTGTEQKVSPQTELNKRFLPNWDLRKFSPQLELKKRFLSNWD